MTGSAAIGAAGKRATEQMHEDMKDAFAKNVLCQSQMLIHTLLDDGFGLLWTKKPQVHRRVERATTRSRIVSYPNGYWVKISINDNDNVSYKLFNSGWVAKALHKIGFRTVVGSGWSSVKQRDNIESTLGATYMAIDEAIQEDMKKLDHSQFLKEMIKTDPDNLKAIAQLDMLDKGDGPGSEPDQDDSPSMPPTTGPGIQYSNNMVVSGSGTFIKKDDSQPASLVTTPIEFGGGNANTISFGSDVKDAIKVEPDGKVSFGDKMVEAIRETVNEEREKLNGTE